MTAHLSTDLTAAWRSLRATPLLSLAAFLTLAVALAGTLATWALLDAVMLRSLPYRDADRLVVVWADHTSRADEINLQDPKREWTNFDDVADLAAARSLDGIGVFMGWNPTLSGDASVPAERLVGAIPSWDLFSTLGVQPMLGRGFLAEEGVRDGPTVVVLGHGLWQRRFGGDPAIIGQTIELNRTAYTVIGVMPPGFRFPFAPQAELYTVMWPNTGDRGNAFLRVIARLADGRTLAQAQQEVSTIAAAVAEQHPASNRSVDWFVEPLQTALGNAVRPQLVVLQLAALLVLVIGAANLASLMVSRSQKRQAEFALREAVGATPARRLRQLFVEALVLAAIASVGALVLARLAIAAFVALFPQGFDSAWDVRLDAAAVALACAIAVVIAAVLATAAEASLRRGMPDAGGTRIAGQRGGGRIAAIAVGCNFALALAVTLASLLLLDSHRRLAATDTGFHGDRLLAGALLLPSAAYADDAALFAVHQRLRETVRDLPGVDAVALSTAVPLGVGASDTSIEIEGHRTSRVDGRAHVWLNRVDAEFLPLLGVRLREGRPLRDGDAEQALVNAAFVRQYLGDEPALGRRLRTGERSFDIVGVVDDVRWFDLDQPQTPWLYLPMAADPMRGVYLTVRTRGDAAELAGPLQRAIAAIDPALALSDLRPIEQRVDSALAMPRAVSRITLLFAAAGLLLAGIGVYGTLAHSVLRRTREFGVRRALGAGDRVMLALVLGQSLRPALIGLVLGVPLAVLFARELQGVLYGIGPWQPVAWLGAIAVPVAVAMLAAWLPARRALVIPPMVALRYE